MNRTVPAVLAVVGWLAPARADAPKLLKPVALTVNTRADEDDPHVADRGLTLYYASNAKGKWDIMVSRRRFVRAAWPAGKVLEDFVSTVGDDRSVCATEGRYPHYLYFATKKDKKSTNYDIYAAVKQD